MCYRKLIYVLATIFASTFIFAQTGQKNLVTGTVSDESGETLIGVFVMQKGGKEGVSTDLNGNYKIAAPQQGKKYTLVFQYLGMKTVEVEVKGPQVLNITMKNDNALDGAVIVGAYGTVQRREDLVGSAYQVNSDAIKLKSAARADNLLEGLIPGMTIEANTDAAGSTRTRYETRIRGTGSLSGSSEPLWIIDGVPQYMGSSTGTMPGMSYTISPLSYINTDDIESITVLKDADQVSIYGANGANGVILVTTKNGSHNTPLRVNASARYGIATIDKTTMFKVMNAAQYMEVAKEAWVNAGNIIENFPYQDNDYNSYSTTDTYWPDVYLGMGNEFTGNVSIGYGTKKVTGRISGSYYQKNNIVQSDKQQRFTVSTKTDVEFIKDLHFTMSLNASYNDNDIFSLSSGSYLETQPIFSPYLEDGTTYRLYNKVWDQTKQDFKMQNFYYNYVPDREDNDNHQRTVVTDATFALNYKIFGCLKLSSTFGIKYNSGHEDMYYARTTLRGMDSGKPIGSSSKKDVSYLTWSNNNILTFNKSFDKHQVMALAGLEFNSQSNKYTSISGSGFMNDYIKELEYAEKISTYSYTNVKNSRDMSYFGRLEYNYDGRYIVSGNIRRNGNSIFGKYNKWGTFWSAGASWNIHKEHFWNVPWMNVLKIKATYGKAGNSKIDATTATGTYNYSDSYSYLGVPGAIIGSVPNPGLSWETTYQTNVGISMEFLKRFNVEIEAYDYLTDDLLSKVYVSRTISEDRQYANIGKVRNRGIELSLDFDIIRKGDWNWNLKLNAAHNRNRIEELYNGVSTSFGSTIWMEGYSTDTHMLIRWAGVDPLDGSPLWYDKNGNLTKEYNYDNRVPGKTSNPDVTGGLTSSLSWKGLSLSMQMNYTIGGWANPTYGLRMMNDGYDIISGNQAVEVYYYRWKEPGDLASFPKVSNNSQHATSYNDRFLTSRTNFKLSNISLSYAFPDKAIKFLGVKGITTSFLCDNVFVFCPGMNKDFNSYKTMMSGYPVTRTYTFALSLSF